MELSEPSTTGLEKMIWKLKAPRKIKHFLWSTLSGFVASASKLKERHCGTDETCQQCGEEKETINHILFECLPSDAMLGAILDTDDSGRIPMYFHLREPGYTLWLLKGTSYAGC